MHEADARHDWRVDGAGAHIAGAWSDALAAALQAHRPPRVELAADWPSLAPLGVIGPSLTTLVLSGPPATGRVTSTTGLSALPALRSLEVAGTVRGGLVLEGLGSLERLDVQWQRGADAAFALPGLRHLTLRGYGGSDLAALRGGPALASLWLANTGIESLRGLSGLAGLAALRITRARRLAQLEGVQQAALQTLDIDDARGLVSLDALAGTTLSSLRLMHISPEASLDVIGTLPALHSLIIGGRQAPVLDWRLALSHPRLRVISGWWTPATLPETAMRACLPPGRSFARFDPGPGRDARPLVVQIAG